jgi:Fur family ferric uptake transcriptional regulator
VIDERVIAAGEKRYGKIKSDQMPCATNAVAPLYKYYEIIKSTIKNRVDYAGFIKHPRRPGKRECLWRLTIGSRRIFTGDMVRGNSLDKNAGKGYIENGYHFQQGVFMPHGHRWGQKLSGCGFRLTVGREAIIDVLSRVNKHVSAEDIFLALRSELPGIGLTTVYRTLELLVQTGIVAKFDFGHGRARYELTEEFGEKTHHHHLICKNCQIIIDYSDFLDDEFSYIKKTEKGLSKKYNFDIESHIITFYGLCDRCRAK